MNSIPTTVYLEPVDAPINTYHREVLETENAILRQELEDARRTIDALRKYNAAQKEVIARITLTKGQRA